MSKLCIINTIKTKIRGNATSYIERENEIFIPKSDRFTLEQTYKIAVKKVDKINQEYLSEKFGKVVSLNTSASNGTGIKIHPSQLLIDAYEVKEGNKSIEELNPRNLDYFNGDEALFEQEQNDELKPFIDESKKIADEIKDVEQQVQEKTIKPGVEELFNENPELNKIGTVEQYDSYLDTIFPDSQVKDIVYHGTDTKFDNFSKDFIGSKEKGALAYGFNFGGQQARVYAGNFGKGEKVLLSNLVSLQNPLILKGEGKYATASYPNFKENNFLIDILKKNGYDVTQWQYYKNSDNGKIFDYVTQKVGLKNFTNILKKEGYDGVLSITQSKENPEIVVFEPEQIHILGSKQDIKGFKEFVSKKINNNKADESINERLMRYEESIKIPNNVKSKVLEKIEKETEKVKEKLLSLGLKQDNNKFELITNSYATFKMKLKELENVNAIISTNKTSDFYQIIARLKNVDSTMELKKQGELPFTPIEVKQVIQEQQFLNDVADNVFEGLSEEEKQILKKKIENGDYDLNCRI